MEYYSQFKQDLFVNRILTKRNGFFLDIGANGGVIDSNTYFLEKYKGWNGICIEPISDKFKILESIRKAKCYNIGISDKNEIMKFYHVKGYAEMLSGIVNSFNKEHLDRLHNEVKLHGGEIEVIEIVVKNLNYLLEENKLHKINYCSIDTEGSEYEIISNIDFSKYEITCFSIENNYNDLRIPEYLLRNNYKLVKKLGNDEVYLIQKEYSKILVRLKLLIFKYEERFFNIISRIRKKVKYLILKKKYFLWRHSYLSIREFTTDDEVFDYVFLEKFHRPSLKLFENPIILDLGANVGFSAVDLKIKYPKSKIYCYELDSSNFEALVKNTANINDIYPYNKAVWIQNETIYYDEFAPCDSFHIDNSDKNKKTASGITINSILKENKIQFVDYIKMDIEGSEVDIFNSDLSWLKKTKSIKVEIHNKEHFDFIFSKLLMNGFKVWKDSQHWSTICAEKL